LSLGRSPKLNGAQGWIQSANVRFWPIGDLGGQALVAVFPSKPNVSTRGAAPLSAILEVGEGEDGRQRQAGGGEGLIRSSSWSIVTASTLWSTAKTPPARQSAIGNLGQPKI
jgi:hypothetical protein